MLIATVGSQRLSIRRVHNGAIETDLLTRPMFMITSRTDSGIDLPDIVLTDEKLLGKYGSDLTANFADIKAHGSKAFFLKENHSDNSTYSLCACATGYIWVAVSMTYGGVLRDELDFTAQIGSFALKARAIATVEVPCRYKFSGQDGLLVGHLSLLCSTVMAKYLRLRMMGRQYEEATDIAIKQTRTELASFEVADASRYRDLNSFLAQVCGNAPMPPTSDVSLISRSMVTKRWQYWRESSVLRKRYFFPQRVIRCFKKPQHDSIDLLSSTFKALAQDKTKKEVVRS